MCAPIEYENNIVNLEVINQEMYESRFRNRQAEIFVPAVTEASRDP